MRIRLRRPSGEEKIVFAGEEYDAEDWQVVGVVPEDMAIVNREDVEATALIQEIEADLKNEGRGFGDWVKMFANPVAKLLGKQDCMACEVRRVILNATKLIVAKQGRLEGRKTIMTLLKRSFTEPEEAVLEELRAFTQSEG
jgi:hypothetical protein